MKLLYIEWVDAESGDAWAPLKDLKEEREPHLIKTLGFAVKETKKFVTLAMNWDQDADSASMTMVIPKGMIKLREEIY